MRLKYLIAAALAAVLLVVVTIIALAQSVPPSPYAGLTNPFDWNDAQAQAAGKNIYGQQCSGCHGSSGAGIPDFDFSSPSFSQNLEAQPDYYFWVFSEGRLDKGMPPYKSSLSDEQRWQTLTYLHSLSSAAPSPGPSAPNNGSTEGAALTLTASHQANSGQNLTFTAVLKDAQDKPVSGAAVNFFLTEDFFAQGQMEIGEAITDEQGSAVLYYTPKRAGEKVLIAKYQALESKSELNVLESGQTFYHPEVGINFDSIGPEIFVGPDSSHQLGEMGFAPAPALRLPGGIFSWLWLYIGVLALIWGVYLIVMYQTLRISDYHENQVPKIRLTPTAVRTNTRLIPLIALVVVFGLGLLMVLMVITGPYSHFQLTP